MGCCGNSDGSARLNTSLVFSVQNDVGQQVELWPSFHEARVRAEFFGPSFKVVTKRLNLNTNTVV